MTFITFAKRVEKVLCHSASVTLSHFVYVYIRHISLDGKGNTLYPVLSSYSFVLNNL